MKKLLIVMALMIPSFLGLSQNIFELNFIVGITQYRAALAVYDNGYGTIRVRYFSERPQMVEQSAKVETTSLGIRVTCYKPVYPGTTVRHPSYQPDNFYLFVDEYGNLKAVNIDDAGTTAAASIRIIEGKYYINKFLSDFDWKID